MPAGATRRRAAACCGTAIVRLEFSQKRSLPQWTARRRRARTSIQRARR